MSEETDPIIDYNQRAGYSTMQNRPDRDVSRSDSSDSSNCSKSSPQLSVWSKLGFAFGHIDNDMSASLWFSYCLLFLTKVLEVDATEAGGLIMFGQVIDGVATPILGYLMDKFSTKQKWHIFCKFL